MQNLLNIPRVAVLAITMLSSVKSPTRFEQSLTKGVAVFIAQELPEARG